MFAQQRHILQAVAQRRKWNWHNVQAEEEVFAKLALLHPVGKVAISGGDHTNIDLLGDVSADTFKGAFLKHTQKFRLNAEINFADFIQQKRAAIREFKAAFAEFVSAGESAFLVTEEFRFEQVGGKSSAIQTDHGASRAGALRVDHLGDVFFSSPALAGNQDGGGAAGRNLLDAFAHVAEQRAVSDEDFRRRRFGIGTKDLIVSDELTVLDGAVDDHQNFFALEGLLNIIEGTETHGLHGSANGGERRHEDDRNIRRLRADFLQQFDAVHLRHLEISDHTSRTMLAHKAGSFRRVAGCDRLMPGAGHRQRKRIPHHFLGIHDQNGRHPGCSGVREGL